MVENIDKLIESVIEREDLMKELAEQENYDDVYDFCVGVEDGYTKQELAGFLNNLDEEDYRYFMSDYDLNRVSAGTKNKFEGVNLDSFPHDKDFKNGVTAGEKTLEAMQAYKKLKSGPPIFKPTTI